MRLLRSDVGRPSYVPAGAGETALVVFCAGGLFLAVTSALNFGHAPSWRVVLEESCKLLGVASFLLAYRIVFLRTLDEVSDRARGT